MDKVRQRHTPSQKEAASKETASKTKLKAPDADTEDKEKKSTVPPAKQSARGRCCSWACVKTTVFCVVLLLLCVGIGVGCVVSQSPKDLDEQWEDVQSYAQWWWTTMWGATTPCTYAGVRHYRWGGAVDDASTCGCWLRRCPPSQAPTTASRGAVVVSRSAAAAPTVESLWETCAAAHSPVTRDNSIDPLRVFDAPVDSVARGIFANVRSPMCVQSGRVYAALRPNSSLLTITYRTGVRESFYTNLTDAVLKRGSKYHPITTVPAAALLFSIEGQAGNLFTLIQEGLRGWSALMERGFGLGFTSAEDRQVWQEAPRQVVFLSDPSMDIPQETAHSSAVARELANAFSVPTQSPFFAVAPLSRTRSGEGSREPMYCFCGGFMVPSIGIVDLSGSVGAAGYPYMRRTVNEHFGGAALGDADPAATEAMRTGSPFYSGEVRAAWPPRTGAALLPSPRRRPRMLWVGRKRPRVEEEARYIAMARSIGFEVLVDATYVTEASAARQFYQARYADVVAGFHGAALMNAVWMDVTARPQCRTLLEFIPYASAKQVARVYGAPVTSAGVRHVMVEPIDLHFTGAAFDTAERQETAKRELMGEGPKGKYVMGHPAFTKHRAIYDPATVEVQLRELYAQLMECL